MTRPLAAVPDGPDDAHRDVDPFTEATDTVTSSACRLSNGPANVQWLRGELGTPNMPGVFLRGGRLVYVASIGTEGYIAPRHAEDDNGPATVTPLTPLGLSTRVGDHYAVERYNAKEEKWKPAHFPNDDAARVMETTDQAPYLRPLRGVTHTAIAQAKVGLLTAAGYDEESGYLLEPDVDIDDVPAAPTAAQVAEATTFLRHLVSDFVWGDDDSEANFWGSMLTPLLRLATPPPYKLFAITARERGSGKSLLAELPRIVHGGSMSTWPGDEEEVHKVISSKLHCTTAPVLQFDNVRGELRSGKLEMLATSPTYDVRVLGSTNEFSLVNDRMVIFTGNNMTIGGDLGRRMCYIDIDPGVARPEARTGFDIPDLSRYVKRNRARILHALLTWVAAWDSLGRPTDGDVTSDSYGHWIASVRAILKVAEVPGTFCAHNPERDDEVNPDEAEWGEFLRALRDVFDDGAWTAKDVTALIDKAPGTFTPPPGFHEPSPEQRDGAKLKDALPDQLLVNLNRGGSAATISRSLGKWISHRKGQWMLGHTVRKAGEDPKTKVAVWRVDVEASR